MGEQAPGPPVPCAEERRRLLRLYDAGREPAPRSRLLLCRSRAWAPRETPRYSPRTPLKITLPEGGVELCTVNGRLSVIQAGFLDSLIIWIILHGKKLSPPPGPAGLWAGGEDLVST